MPVWSTLSLQDMTTILKRDDIVVPSEHSVYVAVQNCIVSQNECPLETIKEVLSLVEFRCMTSFELIQVETSTLATALAPEWIRQRLYMAFRYLSVIAENQKREVKPTRTYIKNKVENVTFRNRSTFITPRYYSYKIAQKYSWKLQYTQDHASNTSNFRVTLPSVSRERQNVCFIYKEIPGTVHVSITVLFQSVEGVTTNIDRISKNTQMPKDNGGCVVSFSASGVQSVPPNCLVSFELSRSE